jgi:general L-amino acid transport system substrate-binding protein
MEASPQFAVQALLGRPLGTGTLLGLDRHWARNMIETTGNYGEIFARDLGAGSPLRLNRGENRLWSQGGLMYAPLLDAR